MCHKFGMKCLQEANLWGDMLLVESRDIDDMSALYIYVFAPVLREFSHRCP
ncbi:hypothetical protein CULCOIPH002_03990 [Corynebacterium ulcerans]|uniref:Uncharacterized protein n=1 Tax=Corynebacterium ulcerans TaxID=65058 RepID=A0ABD0BFL6_CORUL|nr:hypothetical protein CULCOIPH001_00070 [Corynebacterium ulcerans]GJJ35487.1 hypothetical protein CULCOIPH002_03990 [Corynebacterium ulcerans]GJJ39257.1 hypothetical protein CULCOIPH003_18880 [Corynebacterium ulcerans]GJJ39596.1 hypothetical protein CULCOIPH004_00070 [Corynebacterium ulcerans]GJJ42593.1 hypothetical protein CULCOIPH005_07820 [Corynebacterium ulcerans]